MEEEAEKSKRVTKTEEKRNDIREMWDKWQNESVEGKEKKLKKERRWKMKHEIQWKEE